MDLYDAARELPYLIRGRMEVATLDDLRRQGQTEDAVRWRANGGGAVRAHRGVYLRGSGPPDLLDTIHAALVACPPRAVLGFHTAAMLFGFGVVRSRNIHVVVPAGTPFPQRPRIVAHQSVVPIGEPVDILGVRCTTAARSAVDLARRLCRLDAMAVLDAALHAGACSIDSLLAELKAHDGLRGVRQVRDLAPFADPRPQCRQESQLRLIVYDGGLRGFEPQLPVADKDRYVRHYLDLGDRRNKVAAEYDGASHLDRHRLRSDRARHNWLSRHGWRMCYFTDHDLYVRPEGIVDTLRSARLRRER